MKIKIRPGLLFDVQTIAEFQVKMALETEDLKLDPPTVYLGVEAVFNDPSKGKYWVAENEKGEVVGCLLTVPEWSDWRNGTVLWIHSVFVREDFRAQGVFKELYLHLKKQVEESRDLRGLRLYVEKKNTKASQVYRKLGMSDEHYHLFEWLK